MTSSGMSIVSTDVSSINCPSANTISSTVMGINSLTTGETARNVLGTNDVSTLPVSLPLIGYELNVVVSGANSVNSANSNTSLPIVSTDNVLGRNPLAADTNSSPAMGINSPVTDETASKVLGTNDASAIPVSSPLIGLNNESEGVVLGANNTESVLNNMSVTTKDATNNQLDDTNEMCENINVPNIVPSLYPNNVYQDHNYDVNTGDTLHENSDCEMYMQGDPHLDASLSGALEKLSVAELSVIDTLVSLHMISDLYGNSGNYIHQDHNYHMMYNDNNTHVPPLIGKTENSAQLNLDSSIDGLQCDQCEIDNSVHDILLTMENPSVEQVNVQSVTFTVSSSDGSDLLCSPGAGVLGTNTPYLTSSSEFEGFMKTDLETAATKYAKQQCVIDSNKYDNEGDHVSAKNMIGTNNTLSCEMGINTNCIDTDSTSVMGANSVP